MAERPDKVLIEEINAGRNREENFRILFERYRQLAYQFFRKNGSSAEESRDLTQETFFRVFRSVEHFRGESSFKTWLYEIARNLWRNAVRDRVAKKREGIEVPLDLESKPCFGASILEEAERRLAEAQSRKCALEDLLAKERHQLLESSLSRLSPDLQKLLTFQIDHELTCREIAEAAKIPEGTVKSRLARARSFLREEMGRLYTEFHLEKRS